MSYSSEKAANSLRELNSAFQADRLKFGPVHDTLRRWGFTPEQCVALECTPDSGGTYLFKFVSPDRLVYEADLDMSSPIHNQVEPLGPFPRRGSRRIQIEDGAIEKLFGELAAAQATGPGNQ